jgi:hypothetical protein
MRPIKTYKDFLNESSGFENDKKFWDLLTKEEQALIMKDFGYDVAPSKKPYDSLHTEFYNELRDYLIGINYDKKHIGKNPQESEHPYFSGLSSSTKEKKKGQMKKQAEMDDDDPEAYKEMPGDKKGKKSMKTSKHTLKYREMFSDKKK